MKITCQKNDLLSSINIALRAVSAKTTMPILECIAIDVTDSFIKFTTNDMELGIETIVKGVIEETGSVAINAKILSDIIRKLPDQEICIDSDFNYNVTITCGKSKFSIPAKVSDEFPYLPSVERADALTLSQFTLKELIRQTVFSISDSENNKLMTGELFEVNNNKLRIVSLDGHRISVRKVDLKNSFRNLKVVVPGKTLNEISKILSGEMSDEVNIYFTDKHVLFEFDDTLVLSRLIEGEYYKIDQMLTGDFDTKVFVNKKDFLDSIDRATLLVKESEKKPIIIDIKDTEMSLEVTSNIGSMNENIDITKEGSDILIGFNPKFLIDALRAIDDDEVNLYMTNPKAPCFIKDAEENYIYLILPVNFTAPSR